MDVSASMQKQDFYPNRFVAAQSTASRFISKRLNDRIGLVAFAKEAMLQAPLTLDHEALQEYLSTLYLGVVDANYTAIGDALDEAEAAESGIPMDGPVVYNAESKDVSEDGE